jgi:hypothetical protein
LLRLRYDPLGRAIRVDLPDGTFSQVAFSPWQQTSWDASDTVLESEWYLARIVLPAVIRSTGPPR